MKRMIALFAAVFLILSFAVSCRKDDETDEGAQTAEIIPIDSVEMFADGDTRDVTAERPDAEIVLSGSTGTISDTTRGSSGSQVTITAKGTYRVTGSSENVTIRICESTKSGNVYLILDGVTMTNSQSPCIYVEKADKAIIQCAGENSFTYTATNASLDGAICAKDDVTINGSGSLSIDSSLHGIVAKNDLKLLALTLDVKSSSIGLKAGDSVRISDANVTVASGHDGVQVKNDTGDSLFYIESGSLLIDAGYDGIDVGTQGATFTGSVSLAGGTVGITSGGGSDNSANSGKSKKGIKSDGNILVGEALLTVSSSDDAVNGKENVQITGGSVEISSSDDGIHAANVLTIAGGKLNVKKSYEGLEANGVVISGGEVSVIASDDGINVAGGSDVASPESSAEDSGLSSQDGTLTISGGNVYINSQGDGFDSNTSIFITGGFVIVEGPSGSGNGAIDKGEGANCVASITGGTFLAIGSSEMAINFNAGTQCSALLALSGSAGDTITADDGSGFSFTVTKEFSSVVYSSPSMTQGNSYTVSVGTSSASADFSSSLYYSNVSGRDGFGGPTSH